MKTLLKTSALIAVIACAGYGYGTQGESLVVAPTDASASQLAINPQPLPPRYLTSPERFDSLTPSESRLAINPQPLPPRELTSPEQFNALPPAASRVAINPQPLPPLESTQPERFDALTPSESRVAINPQPLPPLESTQPDRIDALTPAESRVAINPQPLPPNSRSLEGPLAEQTMPVTPAPLDEPPMLPAPYRVAPSGQPWLCFAACFA